MLRLTAVLNAHLWVSFHVHMNSSPDIFVPLAHCDADPALILVQVLNLSRSQVIMLEDLFDVLKTCGWHATKLQHIGPSTNCTMTGRAVTGDLRQSPSFSVHLLTLCEGAGVIHPDSSRPVKDSYGMSQAINTH